MLYTGGFEHTVAGIRISAISVGAEGIAAASTFCLPRLTHSDRFLLRRMTHWVTASFVPRRVCRRSVRSNKTLKTWRIFLFPF